MKKIVLAAIIGLALLANNTLANSVTYTEPSSDIQNTGWTEGNGNHNNLVYDELNDGFRISRGRLGYFDDDGSYWQSPLTNQTSYLIVRFSPMKDPGVDTGHLIRISARTEYQSIMAPGLECILYSWINKVTSFTIYPLWLPGYTDGQYMLTESEARKIIDYQNLFIGCYPEYYLPFPQPRIYLSSIELEWPGVR